jgi:hypothetical protein
LLLPGQQHSLYAFIQQHLERNIGTADMTSNRKAKSLRIERNM